MFIRWQLKSGKSINWETQWARMRSDHFYRKRDALAPSNEEFNKYMANLDSDGLYGYYSFLWAMHVLLNTERHTKGVEFLETANTKWPQSLNAKMWLAKVYIQSDDEEKYIVAEDICKELLQKVDDNYEVWNVYGQTQKKMDDYTTAIEAFKKSIKLHPNNLTAYKSLGEIYFENEDLENACVNLIKAKQIDKNVVFDKEVNEFFVEYCEK